MGALTKALSAPRTARAPGGPAARTVAATRRHRGRFSRRLRCVTEGGVAFRFLLITISAHVVYA